MPKYDPTLEHTHACNMNNNSFRDLGCQCHLEATPKWTAGYNLTGYLPDEGAVEQFDTWQEAREYLLNEVERFWEQDAMDLSEDFSDAEWQETHEALSKITPGQTGGAYHGNYSYWIQEATN